MSLGNQIKKCRKSKKLTQKELSIKLGLTPKMISFYEHNERTPPIDILKKISEIFSVSTDYLLELTDDSTPANKRNIFAYNPDEEVFYRLFHELNNDYRDILLGELKKCVKMQEQEQFMQNEKKTKRQA